MEVQSWDDWATKLAGVAGAFVSMRFLSGPWPGKLMMVAGGAVTSWFATPYVHERLSLPEGLAGFLIGLFGMAIFSRIWDGIQTMSIKDFVLGFFKK